MTNEEEMMKRHLGQKRAIDLGEDKIWLAPLKVEDIPDLIELQSELGNVIGKEGNISISKEIAKKCIDLLSKSIKGASPDLDDELIGQVVGCNLLVLLPGLFAVNTMASERDIKKAEKIAKIKEITQSKS